MVNSKSTVPDKPTLPVPAEAWRVRDVMRFLGVSREQVYTLINKRKLPYSVVGNAYRFHPAAVAQWFEKEQHTR